MPLVAVWFLIINLVAFCLFGADKRRARQGLWRISEAALMTSAVLGGSIGALAGMRFFHHKTRHLKFTVGVPLLLAAQIALAVWCLTVGFHRY